jgi:hypothetical protein
MAIKYMNQNFPLQGLKKYAKIRISGVKIPYHLATLVCTICYDTGVFQIKFRVQSRSSIRRKT